ncbi:oligosaccharide flippase family protein [Flavihumibacter sp. R14]|nr:oligosaccharide flippase family protein [Flavihumibacter soli]
MLINKQAAKFQNLLGRYKTPVLYSGGSIVKAIAQLLAGFIIAKFIAPDDLGLWTTLNLAVTYSVFLQAGLINGLNLELPAAYGRGREEDANQIAGTVQLLTIISSIAILLIGVLCFLFMPIIDPKIRFGLLGITLFIAISFYQNYLMSTFRSKNSFSNLAIIQMADGFVNLITLVLVVYYTYYGLILKSIIVILIYVLLLHIYRPIRVKLVWSKEVAFKLIKVGLPIFGLSYIVELSTTVDRLVLLKYADITSVGLYSFGFYALSTFTILSASIASYIYPQMTYRYAKDNDKIALWIYLKKITLFLFIGQLLLAIVGYYIIPFLVKVYFPTYILSISTMQILLFAGVFKGSVIGANALWSMKHWKYMVIYQVNLSVLLVALPYSAVYVFQNKIEGVAYGILLANAINLLFGLYLTYLATHEDAPAVDRLG